MGTNAFRSHALAGSALLLSACAHPGTQPPAATGDPDLVPVPRISGFNDGTAFIDFCDRDEGGDLIVTIRNQGAAPATGGFTSRVTFAAPGSPSQPIMTPPGFGPGAVQATSVPIPAGCFNPDCGFTIEVDVGHTVDEANEGNNVGAGRCIG